MQIVIDISDKVYGLLKYFEKVMGLADKKENGDDVKTALMRAVVNGTPLPKGHGRLIDADDLEHITVCSKTRNSGITRIEAPTIIEADKAEDLDNLDSMLEDLWNATESEDKG